MPFLTVIRSLDDVAITVKLTESIGNHLFRLNYHLYADVKYDTKEEEFARQLALRAIRDRSAKKEFNIPPSERHYLINLTN
jgi:hypothetical protein